MAVTCQSAHFQQHFFSSSCVSPQVSHNIKWILCGLLCRASVFWEYTLWVLLVSLMWFLSSFCCMGWCNVVLWESAAVHTQKLPNTKVTESRKQAKLLLLFPFLFFFLLTVGKQIGALPPPTGMESGPECHLRIRAGTAGEGAALL